MGEDADYCVPDPAFLNEVVLFVEDPDVVVVEADDEAGLNDQAAVAHALHFGEHGVASRVLELTRLVERLRARRLESDEHLSEFAATMSRSTPRRPPD